MAIWSSKITAVPFVATRGMTTKKPQQYVTHQMVHGLIKIWSLDEIQLTGLNDMGASSRHSGMSLCTCYYLFLQPTLVHSPLPLQPSQLTLARAQIISRLQHMPPTSITMHECCLPVPPLANFSSQQQLQRSTDAWYHMPQVTSALCCINNLFDFGARYGPFSPSQLSQSSSLLGRLSSRVHKIAWNRKC